MDTEKVLDNVKAAWQRQEGQAMQLSLEEIRRRASAFEHKIRRRDIREYVAGIIVIAGFGWFLSRGGDPVIRVAFGLIIAGTCVVMYQLHKRSRPASAPAEAGGRSCLDFYKSELARQRDLLRSVWTWYIGPLIPGMALFIGRSMALNPARTRWFGGYAAITAALFFIVGELNRRGARRLQETIDRLESLQ